MDFRRDFTYEVMCKVFGVIFAIALAYALRSYWALIYGQVAAQSMRVLLSFVVAPRWPRPTLSHWRLIWAFSQWSLLSGFARFIVLHADKLILGRLATSEVVGAYALGREIAELPLSEITGPANRAFGPGFAEIQQERNRLAWALAKALGALATIAFPVALGLALTADELVFVMLGERWAATAPILEILAATTMFLVLRAVMGNTLVVLGFIRRLTIQGWIRAISYLAVAVPMTMSWGAIGLAAAFTVAELLAGLMMLHAYRRLLPELTLKLFVSGIARPGIGVAIMSACVLGVAHSGIAQIHLLLAGKVAAGVFSYTLVMYLLWRRAGRPDGLEAMALQRLRRWQPTK
jgi:O-antigen/teichoic acid export membrane protein